MASSLHLHVEVDAEVGLRITVRGAVGQIGIHRREDHPPHRAGVGALVALGDAEELRADAAEVLGLGGHLADIDFLRERPARAEHVFA